MSVSATKTAEEFITLDGLDDDIAKLNKVLDELNTVADGEPVREILVEAGKLLSDEQKRILSQKQFKNSTIDLKSLIRIKTTHSKGYWKVSVGYSTEVIKNHIEVLIIEFGRPGTKGRKNGGKDSKGRKIGVVAPHSHIRAASFSIGDEVREYIGKRFFEEIQKRWEE